jgi:hypothetical protein
MTIRQAIWKIGPKPEPLPSATLPSEATLEAMIVASPSILHDQWMIRASRAMERASTWSSWVLPGKVWHSVVKSSSQGADSGRKTRAPISSEKAL